MRWMILILTLILFSCGDTMASRWTPSGNVSTISQVNGEFETAAEAQRDLLSRTDPTGNQMEVGLDMNSNRIYNLPEPQSPNEAARLQDILDASAGEINIQLVQQEGVINVKQQFEAGDSLGNTPIENLQKINDAIAYGKAEGLKKLYFPNDIYTISDTLAIPSGWEVFGDVGREGSSIEQTNTDAPVLANEAWAFNTSPVGSTYIHDIQITGSNVLGTNNHGIVLTDFYAKLKNVYIKNCGGTGLFFSSSTENGTFVSSTLVENSINSVEIRNCKNGFRNGFDTISPKLTDGIINNLIIDMNGQDGEVFLLNEAAGWTVNNVHTYTHSTSLKIDRPLAFNASNIYVENRGEDGFVFFLSRVNRGVNFSNIAVTAVLEDGDSVFRVFGAGGLDLATVNINNVMAIAGDNAEVAFALRENVESRINIWNAQPNYSVSAVTQVPFLGVKTAFPMDPNGSYLEQGAEIRLRSILSEQENDFERISIGSTLLPRTAAKKTTYFDSTHTGVNTHEVVLDMPELSGSDFFTGKLVINLSQNFSSTQQAYYSADLLVGSDSAISTNWYTIQNEIGTNVNMSTPPTITVNGAAQTMTIEFTHDGIADLGTGVVSYSFTNGAQ